MHKGAAIMCSLINVIVWEYESDITGLFAPYLDLTSNSLEDEFTKNPQNTSVNLGTFDPSLRAFQVNFTSMTQESTYAGRSRQIRRTLYDTQKTVIGSGISWQWNTDKGWVVYHNEATEAIEDCYQKGLAECDLGNVKFNLPNVVLIQNGYQRNKNTGFVRQIQRVASSYTTDKPIPNTTSFSQQPNNEQGGARRRTDRGRKNDDQQASCSNIPYNTRIEQQKVRQGKDLRELKEGHMLQKFCFVFNGILDDDESCAICLMDFKNDENCAGAANTEDILQLKFCKHRFHESCMEALHKQSQQAAFLQCPVCKKIHGVLTGTQPAGRMTHNIDLKQSVAGYEGEGMITITYEFPSGIQKKGHPRPGHRYTAVGFPRICYLPANEKGRLVLKLLELAFKRKLVFTVGTSTTTGIDNTVTWTNIHHKTSPRSHGGMQGHSYPDPLYLDNVIDELKQNGVTENELSRENDVKDSTTGR